MPILSDLRPLTAIDEANRGNKKILHAKGKGQTLVAEFNSHCPRGELIGVVLGLQETNEAGDPCLVDLPDDVLALPAVRAHLSWGLGSASFAATVDYLHGTQIGLIAENVRVCAEYVVLGGCSRSCRLPCFSVGAGFGYGVRGHNSNSARLTELACIETPGERVRIRVPPFAISVTVLPIDDQPCGIDVVSRCNSHRVHREITTPLGNSFTSGTYDVENALPLFNGAHSVLLENKATGPMAAFVIFGLAL